VSRQSAHRSVHRARLVACRLEAQRIAGLFDADGGADALRQRAERALDRNLVTGDGHLDLGRQLDRMVADT
jgi:hypothetical protein